MAAVTSTRSTALQQCADALHDCVDKIDHLNWKDPSDKKQIVKHLRAFINRVSPEGQEHTLEHALEEIQSKVFNAQTGDFKTIAKIQNDVKKLDRLFSNGKVLKKVANQRSILQSIAAIFKRGNRAEFDKAAALQNYRTKFNELNGVATQKSLEIERAYYLEQCQPLIGFVMRYSPSKAQEFQNRLYHPQADPERVHRELLECVATNIDKFMDRLLLRLDYPNLNFEWLHPDSRHEAFTDHLQQEIDFLKHCVKADLFAGKLNLSYELMKKLTGYGRVDPSVKDYKPLALDVLTKIEKSLHDQSKDKDHEARRLLEKITQLINMTVKQSYRLPQSVNDLLEEAQFSKHPGEHLTELRKAYKEMKGTYVDMLQEDLEKFRLEREKSHLKGFPTKDRWMVRLLQNRDFKTDVIAFADRFGAEKDQFHKIALWQNFMRQAQMKYAPQLGQGTEGIVQAILLTCPTKKFLSALVDLDASVLKADFHDHSYMTRSLDQIYNGINSILAPSSVETERLQARINHAKILCKDFKKDQFPELRREQVRLERILAAPTSRIEEKTLREFSERVKAHEKKVVLTYEVAFATACKQKLEALLLPPNRVEIDRSDLAFLHNQFIDYKDDVNKLALFQDYISNLCRKYSVNKSDEGIFLQRLLLQCYGSVGATIRGIDRNYISAHIPGERVSEQRARQEAYKSLMRAVDAIMRS